MSTVEVVLIALAVTYSMIGAFFVGVAMGPNGSMTRACLMGAFWPFMIAVFLGAEVFAAASRHLWLHQVTTVVETEGAAFPKGTSFHRVMKGRFAGKGWTLYFAVPHDTDQTNEEKANAIDHRSASV